MSVGTSLAVVVSLLAAVAVGAAPTARAATLPSSRAMWVWDSADPTLLVADAATRSVRDLYVSVTPTVQTDGELPRLRELARLAAPAGIRLLALGGDPAWTTNPAAAIAWQRAALGTGLFAASHVDVEPYLLAGWSNPRTRATLVKGYVDLLARLQSDSSAPLEVDIPFWYNTISSAKRGGTLADDVLTRVDAVTVMSYRDSAAGILDVGRDVLDRADALAVIGRRVPVRLAAETNPLPDCDYCTFAQEGSAALALALATVDAASALRPSYAGMAVHDHLGWLALRP